MYLSDVRGHISTGIWLKSEFGVAQRSRNLRVHLDSPMKNIPVAPRLPGQDLT